MPAVEDCVTPMIAETAERGPRAPDGTSTPPGEGTTTLLLVRHAEVHNPERVLYGRLPNFRLSEAGERQAERVATALAGRPVSAIYSSPLLRARQTAAAIARHHPAVAPRVTTLLHEIGSSWQGTPFAEFKPGFSAYDHRREPGDESLEDVRDRMVEFAERARARHPGETIVGVSHGDPITILRVVLGGRPLTPAALRGADYAGLGSITELVFELGAERPRIAWVTVPWSVPATV